MFVRKTRAVSIDQSYTHLDSRPPKRWNPDFRWKQVLRPMRRRQDAITHSLWQHRNFMPFILAGTSYSVSINYDNEYLGSLQPAAHDFRTRTEV